MSAWGPPTTAVEVSVRSGSVRITVGDVSVPAIAKGRATIDDRGLVRAPSGANVDIVCPAGTNVFVATVSAAVVCEGPLGSVRISSTTGRIEVQDCLEADLRTRTGKIVVGTAQRRCRATSTTGSVHVTASPELDVTVTTASVEAGGIVRARVHGAAGGVRLVAVAPGDVDVRTMSGRVDVEVQGDWAPTTDLRATSGSIRDRLPDIDRDGRLQVRTMSGRITVSAS